MVCLVEVDLVSNLKIVKMLEMLKMLLFFSKIFKIFIKSRCSLATVTVY